MGVGVGEGNLGIMECNRRGGGGKLRGREVGDGRIGMAERHEHVRDRKLVD